MVEPCLQTPSFDVEELERSSLERDDDKMYLIGIVKPMFIFNREQIFFLG